VIVKTLKFDGNWRFVQYGPTDTINPTNLAPGGSNGDVLTLDSTQIDGKRWAPISSGNITGSGVPGQVTYWNGINSITGDDNFLWDAASQVFTIGDQSDTYFKVDVTGHTIDVISGSGVARIGSPGAGNNTYILVDDSILTTAILADTFIVSSTTTGIYGVITAGSLIGAGTRMVVAIMVS